MAQRFLPLTHNPANFYSISQKENKKSQSRRPPCASPFLYRSVPLDPGEIPDPQRRCLPFTARLLARAEPRTIPSACHELATRQIGGQEEGGGRLRPHLQDTDTSTRVAGMAALSWFKSPIPAVLVYRLSILGGSVVDLSGAHI